MVSAWANANNMVLGQVKVADKSNEITAIPKLLQMLDLSGAVITIDAMGCQTDIASCIIEQKADYVLAVKANQGNLHEQVVEVFEKVVPEQQCQKSIDLNLDHGRIESRKCQALTAKEHLTPQVFTRWKGLTKIIRIETHTEFKSGKHAGKKRSEVRYYITSLEYTVEQLNSIIRTHWGIENKLHWVLDIAFNEDHSRIRKGYSSENMAVVRHIALNKLKREQTHRRGIKNKRKKKQAGTKIISSKS